LSYLSTRFKNMRLVHLTLTFYNAASFLLPENDSDKRWIRTWNDYLQRIKYFFRWLCNQKEIETKGLEPLPTSDWTSPGFCQIKEKEPSMYWPSSVKCAASIHV
ncbi:MAG: hypothetical protein WCC17_01645, partial [Candidatus Nitrosopolaris sp.]